MSRWTDNLSNDVYMRLGNCCTVKSDLPELVRTKWLGMIEKGEDKLGFTKEDALIDILDWLDCNSVFIDLSDDEYNALKI